MNARASVGLLAAIRKGDLKLVQRRLGEGADVDVRGRDGDSALFEAIRLGHRAIVTALLKAGADVTRTCEGYGPLWLAATRGEVKVVEALLVRGAPVEAEPHPLEAAVTNGRVRVAKLLLGAGAVATGRSLLGQAARQGSVPMIAALLEAGLRDELEQGDANGWTPLLAAIGARRWPAAEALIAAGASVDSQAGRERPLALALVRGGAARVRALERAARPRTMLGRSPSPARGRAR